MEEFSYLVEKTKYFVREILADRGLSHLYSENYIESSFETPGQFIPAPYKMALLITDELIHTAPASI